MTVLRMLFKLASAASYENDSSGLSGTNLFYMINPK